MCSMLYTATVRLVQLKSMQINANAVIRSNLNAFMYVISSVN